jgi:uncharacterized protein YbaP (TraB family)
MRIQKITLNFKRLRDSVFENKAKHILESMTDNPNFPDPIPTLVQLQTAITNYSNALVAAAELGKNNVANKNKYRSELELLLFQLGMFVSWQITPRVLSEAMMKGGAVAKRAFDVMMHMRKIDVTAIEAAVNEPVA